MIVLNGRKTGIASTRYLPGLLGDSIAIMYSKCPDANLTIPESRWLSGQGQARPGQLLAVRRPEPRDHSSGESVVDSGFTSHPILNGVVGRCLFLPIAAPSFDFGGAKLLCLFYV